MASTIEASALLRQRYLIKHLLGQGGFGRTYLALDRERFDEPCVLKEFTVSYQDETLVEKAKALFAREASILHQIQHPQIPRFWAAFEWEERLFLVQDYIQGSTYRALLKERRDRGQTFSEAEVLHLLNHLLPVLAYLHDRQIVHRDISPENIVLKPHDGEVLDNDLTQGLPVLLDFGSVKEATSGLALVSTMTRVGKVGYAPPEQLQTGNVQPHSDLYALAATCLVLLTGREPHALLDSLTLDWHWQPYVRVSREFSNILQRMLALHPGDRYQSAKDVHRDLQRLLGVLAPMIHLPQLLPWQTLALTTQSGTTQSTESPVTELPATAMQALPHLNLFSWLPAKLQLYHQGANSLYHQGSLSTSSLFTGSLATLIPRIAVATSLLLTASVGVVVWRSPVLDSQQVLQNPATPELSVPKLPASPGVPQPIEFGAGGISAVVQGSLQENQTQVYTLRAVKGQIMSVMLEGSGVKLNLLRTSGKSIENSARQARNWTGQLPATEEYHIQITGSGAYSLDVTITPTGRPQESETTRLTFAQNPTTVTGEVMKQQPRRYIAKLKAGQTIAFKVLQGDVKVVAIAPNGQAIGQSSTNWRSKIAQAGDYIFEVSTQKREDYALSFEMK
jgi:serine/threonine protein kinase